MHTLKVVVSGLVLLAVCLAVGRWLGSPDPAAGIALGVKAFVPLWFVAAAVNMWVGVARAGYSVVEEAPVFALVFAGPVAVALLVWWLAGRPAT